MISFIVTLAQKDSMNESDDNMMTNGAVLEIVIEEIVNLYVCKNLLLFKFLTERNLFMRFLWKYLFSSQNFELFKLMS